MYFLGFTSIRLGLSSVLRKETHSKKQVHQARWSQILHVTGGPMQDPCDGCAVVL